MSHADVFPQIILKLHIFLETEKVSHQNWIASLSSIPVCCASIVFEGQSNASFTQDIIVKTLEYPYRSF